MKPDSFVRIMLVLIVLFFGLIALKPIFEVSPEGKFNYVHIFEGYSIVKGKEVELVLDLRNGNLWGFPVDLNADPIYLGRLRLEALDKPIKK